MQECLCLPVNASTRIRVSGRFSRFVAVCDHSDRFLLSHIIKRALQPYIVRKLFPLPSLASLSVEAMNSNYTMQLKEK